MIKIRQQEREEILVKHQNVIHTLKEKVYIYISYVATQLCFTSYEPSILLNFSLVTIFCLKHKYFDFS